jgi:hypothetical protein
MRGIERYAAKSANVRCSFQLFRRILKRALKATFVWSGISRTNVLT